MPRICSVESEVPQLKAVVEPEEDMEDDIEYEEIEEEVEEEEEEEFEEEEEDYVAEEGNENEELVENAGHDGDMKDDEYDFKKYNELLALPPHGSEAYIGGLPSNVSENDVRRFCQVIGEVVEVRIILGNDKIYAFVTFRTKELAKKAIDTLNGTELKGKRVKLSTSQAKNKLFIGNVPRNWTEADVKMVVSKIGPGLSGVQLMKDPQISGRNRGFAFIEYYNHACAEFSRKVMSTPDFKLDSNALTVSWADPKGADSNVAAQIKAIYVKNLPKTVTEDQLKSLFAKHGKITKVALPGAKYGQENRIGFVHFEERSNAMKALQNTEIYELDGHVLECSIAKPPADNKMATVTDLRKSSLPPSYSLQPGLLGGGAYGALHTGFAQPMAFGRSPASGVAMVPMVLPDGRFGYVLQQPGVLAASGPRSSSGRDRKSYGGGSSGGGSSHHRGNDSGGGSGRRFRPY